jgi:atypical dual specificity phosphatase
MDSFLYKTSLLKNIVLNTSNPASSPWWNKITKNIIIGGIPLKNQNHELKLVKNEKVKYILSTINKFEINTDTFFSIPVKTHDWNKLGVTQKIIETDDYKGLTFNSLCIGVKFMEKCIDKLEQTDGKIYVHCKAGHGRSVSVVICYLIKKYNIDYDRAYNFVLKKRPTIKLNDKQKMSIVEFYLNYPCTSFEKIDI